ncbi:hypothetical protein DAPPUDRAFT_110425 [Daphnia pulex]|uniref:Uncharacterized protein n=1 Tax=Daphnia pulex TaxID=6669 RepID=E9H683_DAPPU|nr:hypothetical protein DAPPUDRAFT_110425 [Daphnia pulex]|eukprot:EFX72767.1 hypothetical protein DAPPUDRAFT_110425 [Daphnia pulex]
MAALLSKPTLHLTGNQEEACDETYSRYMQQETSFWENVKQFQDARKYWAEQPTHSWIAAVPTKKRINTGQDFPNYNNSKSGSTPKIFNRKTKPHVHCKGKKSILEHWCIGTTDFSKLNLNGNWSTIHSNFSCEVFLHELRHTTGTSSKQRH